jgi:hypothetical protein
MLTTRSPVTNGSYLTPLWANRLPGGGTITRTAGNISDRLGASLAKPPSIVGSPRLPRGPGRKPVRPLHLMTLPRSVDAPTLDESEPMPRSRRSADDRDHVPAAVTRSKAAPGADVGRRALGLPSPTRLVPARWQRPAARDSRSGCISPRRATTRARQQRNAWRVEWMRACRKLLAIRKLSPTGQTHRRASPDR